MAVTGTKRDLQMDKTDCDHLRNRAQEHFHRQHRERTREVSRRLEAEMLAGRDLERPREADVDVDTDPDSDREQHQNQGQSQEQGQNQEQTKSQSRDRGQGQGHSQGHPGGGQP